jgi:hypothetical protein
MKRLLLFVPLLLAVSVCAEDFATRIAPLIEPARLATLGKRGADSRVQKCVYWLAEARKDGASPKKVAQSAVSKAGYNKKAAALTKAALLRNLDIAEKLGCLNADGMARMRGGSAPTVRKGPYAGGIASVDHIIPRAVAPELDNVIANLELLPLMVNESKSDKIGERQRHLAKKFHAAGLLSDAGLKAVLRGFRE